MNTEKVIFGFFVLLALTLNFGFVLGDIDNPEHHHAFELFAALVVSLIATALKLGDRTQIGAFLLASSLVADLQLIAAAIVWGLGTHVFDSGDSPELIASVVSLAAGALLANIASVIVLIIESFTLRR